MTALNSKYYEDRESVRKCPIPPPSFFSLIVLIIIKISNLYNIVWRSDMEMMKNIPLGFITQVINRTFTYALIRFLYRQSIVSFRFIAVIFIIAISTADSKVQTITDTIVISSQERIHVDFKVNLTEVDCEYHGNRAQLEKVLAKIDNAILDPHKKVERIHRSGCGLSERSISKQCATCYRTR